MKRRDLLLSAGILSAMSMAAASPYQGSMAPTGEGGEYYLYQVESGKWLQSNQRMPGFWTTHAELDKNGFDIRVSPIDGGWQIDPLFNRNNSLNGGDDRFYMDTDHPVTAWNFETVVADGVSNAYKIKAVSCGEEIAEPYYIGELEGNLSDAPEGSTWQLVSRADRLAAMQQAVAAGPVDATWLIPWQDFGRNDVNRADRWTQQLISNGGNCNDGGPEYNVVWEVWNNFQYYVRYIVLEGLPNGQYQFNIQGYYRDADINDAELRQRMVDGTEVQRAYYFAGGAQANVQPISQVSSTEAVDGQYNKEITEIGRWVPDGTWEAVHIFDNDKDCVEAGKNGWNQWITANVTDGTLMLGIAKPEGAYHDWLIYDNFQLRYVSPNAATEDVTAPLAELSRLLALAATCPATPNLTASIATGEAAKSSSDPQVIRHAIYELYKYVGAIDASRETIDLYNQTKAITDALGVNTERAQAVMAQASTAEDFTNALRFLRYARRRAAAPKQPDVFAGNAPAEGKYYLYNVGQQQFLQGGSDWGTHASLGIGGYAIELEVESAADMTYHFRTRLGDDDAYLRYRGYMDGGKAGAWQFVPVEGRANTYNIVQADYPDAYMCWNDDGNIDGYGDNVGGWEFNRRWPDETNVCTEQRSPAFDEAKNNPDAMWKLVSAADRAALLTTANIDNPVDATYSIVSPAFNQKEPVEAWTMNGANIVYRGQMRTEFPVESYDTENFDMSQLIENLPAGVYTVWAQGFYRNGLHGANQYDEDGNLTAYGQEETPLISNAYLYAGSEGEAYFPNIMEEGNNAPGEGGTMTIDGVSYNIPQWPDQSCRFFHSGLYMTHFTTNKGDEDLIIGAGKDKKDYNGDWVVLDNFRLSYWGPDTTPEAVEEKLAAGVEDVVHDSQAAPADHRIFNLQGIQVANATTPGIYISNGKKFIVK